MGIFIDLTGKQFGRLTVLNRVENNKSRNSRWLCQCNCGNKRVVLGHNLRWGTSMSCGCLIREITIKRSTKHGHYINKHRTPTYQSWCCMIQRCTNPNNKYYNDYGGRGITVCRKWMQFERFLEDMGERPTLNRSLDRIDNHGDYNLENCRWATRSQQQRNKRTNCLITYDSKTQCLSAWSKDTGLSRQTIRYRLNHNWSVKDTLITPIHKGKTE